MLLLLFQTIVMTTKRFVLDPGDDWGRIPSHHLDRGAFFSTPDPSEEGLLVDEAYDLENIWDGQVDVQEDCMNPANQISGSVKEIKNSVTKVTFISERDCELIQDRVIGAPSLIKSQGGKNK